MSPTWDMNGLTQSFPVRISLRGIDRMGILNEVSNYISNVLGVNIRKVFIGAEDGIFEGYIELLVNDKSALDDVINSLKLVEGIQKIVRTDI